MSFPKFEDAGRNKNFCFRLISTECRTLVAGSWVAALWHQSVSLSESSVSSDAMSVSLRRGFATVAEITKVARPDVRNDWRRSEIQRIFDAPLMESIFRAVRRLMIF